MLRTSSLTDDDKIVARIQAGEEAIEPYAARDRAHGRRYIDPSQEGTQVIGYAGQDPAAETNDQAVGNVPYLRTNIVTKAAAVAFGIPDWHIESRLPDTAPLVKHYLQTLWKSRKWKRITEKALIKRSVSGLGCLTYLWDEKTGPELEHVHLCDLFLDPFVTEFHDLRWGGRKIKMPREEAVARWPDKANKLFNPGDKGYAPSSDKKEQSIDVKVYWDTTTEAGFYGKEVLYKTPNYYGRVPLVFLEGDFDPRPSASFPQGDFDFCSGIAEMRTRLTDVVNNQAQHGGTITLWNPDVFDTVARNAMERGREQGLISCDDLENAIRRIPAEELSSTVIDADRRMEAAQDAAQGVNQYMRGVITQDPAFATEIGATSNLSGARGTQQRLDYEYFLDDIAQAVLSMTVRFGEGAAPEEMILLEAIEAVFNCCAVEQSTAYKDPAAEAMAAANDINLLAPIAPLVGLNLQPLVEDYLRARGKRDLQRYFIQMPQAPGMVPGQEGQQQGAPVPPPAPNGAGASGPAASAPGPAAPPQMAMAGAAMNGAGGY